MSRILIIEDEKSIREEVAEWLEFEGYDVFAAADGSIGIELAIEHLPDIVACDIMMPVMDGYQVLLALREHPETALTPFIFLSAKAERSFVRHGMELGADDYLTKPFTRAELLSAVQTRLDRHKKIDNVHQQVMDAARLKLSRLVTHELKTPLSSIRMIKDVISKQLNQLTPEEVRDLLQSLGAGTDRLNHLIEQMVYLMQLETGVLTPTAITEQGFPIEMWQVLPTATDLARRFAHRNQDIDIQTDTRDAYAPVQGHMPALKHALAELISNAINHSPEHGSIVISQWAADGASWITITDQGDGMTPEELKQALMPFDQINRDAREQQGMGLGLTVAREILESHGGKLELHSSKGKGTQVIVGLPLHAA